MNYYLIRIPIGNTDEDKDTFVDRLIEIYPGTSVENFENLWSRWSKEGVLQILLDVEKRAIMGTMSSSHLVGTFWQLSSDFLNTVPHVDKFLEDPSMIYENESNSDSNSKSNPNSNSNSNSKNKKMTFELNAILDEIAEIGFDNLSKHKQDFLKKESERLNNK